MKRCIGIFFLLLCSIVLVGTVHAESAYWTVQGTSARGWDTTLRVDFLMDETRCRKAYGERWFQQCSADIGGQPGQLARGVRMVPAVAGEWRWVNQGVLRFEPELSLKPNSIYTVDVSGLALPNNVHIEHKKVSVRTLPQAVTIETENVWIDPSSKEEHAFSVPLRFTWPIDAKDFAKRLSLKPEVDNGLVLGTPRITWNQDRREALLSVPIHRLGVSKTGIQLMVDGIPLAFEKNDVVQIQYNNPTAGHRFTVPGRDETFVLRKITLQQDYDTDLARYWYVEFKPSLHMRPQEALNFLQIIELPLSVSSEAQEPFDWRKPDHIDPRDLERGKRLTPEAVQVLDEPTDTLRFRIPATSGRYVFARLRAGAKAANGQELKTNWFNVMQVPVAHPELNLLQPGHVLSLSGERILDLHATNIQEISWRVSRVRDPFLALLARQANFESPYTDFDLLSDVATGTLSVPSKAVGEPQFVALKLDEMVAQLPNNKGAAKGLLFVELQGIDKIGSATNAGTYDRSTHASRLILVSNLGLMLKELPNGAVTAFVSDLQAGGPLADVQVHVLGANGRPVATARTDRDGRADLPSLRGFTREKDPVAVVAVQGDGEQADLAWLSLSDGTRRVEHANFAVAGRHVVADDLLASVFTQRGLYQPGETLRFGCVLRRSDWNALPERLPLLAVLSDPTGRVVLRQQVTVGADGLVTLDWQSSLNSPTGRYRLDFLTGNTLGERFREDSFLGSVYVRLEAFQPDSMTVGMQFRPHDQSLSKGWIVTPPSGQEDNLPDLGIHVRNLYGAPAVDRLVRGTYASRPARLHFAGYEEYTFFDNAPMQNNQTELTLSEKRTNEKGEASVSLPLDRLRLGTQTGTVFVEVQEAAGGRVVIQQKDALFSPAKTLTGWIPKGPGTNLNYIPQNMQTALHFITLDNTLQSVSAGTLSLTLSARRFVNSLVTDARGEYRYDQTPVDNEISKTQITPGADGFLWNIPSETTGDFLLTVKNTEGTTLAVVPFSVAGQSLATPNDIVSTNPVAGNMRIRLDKSTYRADETINVRLSTPYDGYGLLTIERENVLAQQWIRAKAGDSVHSIRIPEQLEGRGYVSLSFVRSQDSEAIYMDPYSVAIEPFTVGMERRDMGLRLELPERLYPGQRASVRVSSKVAGKAVVFAVDEGVLQLTRFQTPNPLRDLLADRALDVETRQIYDLLMPEHTRLRGRMAAFGGGMDASASGRFSNPFKRRAEPPFTLWTGLVDVTPQGVDIPFTVPAHINSRIRFMVVGSALSAPQTTFKIFGDAEQETLFAMSGSAETFVEVRGDLVLSPQLPLAVLPKDRFDGALVLANTTEKDMNVDIMMDTDSAFVAEKAIQESLLLPAGAEKTLPFVLQAQDELGERVVRFLVRHGKATQERVMSLSIRPVTPKVRTEKAGQSNGKIIVEQARQLYPYEAVGQMSVSTAPLPMLRAFMQQLNSYPYGCTEQLISRSMPHAALAALPQLQKLVDSHPNLSDSEQAKHVAQLQTDTLSRLEASLSYGNGVGLWPNTEASVWLTAYAGDFLLTLNEAGNGTSEALSRRLFQSLDRMTGRSPASLEEARALAYAIWVATRYGMITTQELEQLENVLPKLTKTWHNDITAALMAGSYALLRLDKKAQQLLPQKGMLVTDDELLSELGAQALYILVLQRHFPNRLEDGQTIANLVQKAILNLANGQSNTTSAALTVRALLAATQTLHLADTIDSGTVPDIECEAYAAGFTNDQAELSVLDGLVSLNAPGCLRYGITSTAPVYWHVVNDGFDRTLAPAYVSGMTLERRYVNVAGETITPETTLKLGELVTVLLTVRAQDRSIKNAVLVDMLPGALEPLLPTQGNQTVTGSYTRFERQEDRGIFFLDVNTTAQTLTYTTRVVASGRFTAPAAAVTAMYAPTQTARTASTQLVVE